MRYHYALWRAIGYIANINKTTYSGLAVKCGLDATTFNTSKQKTCHGQPRWISTQTLAKILKQTHITPIEFAKIFQMCLDQDEESE